MGYHVITALYISISNIEWMNESMCSLQNAKSRVVTIKEQLKMKWKLNHKLSVDLPFNKSLSHTHTLCSLTYLFDLAPKK